MISQVVLINICLRFLFLAGISLIAVSFLLENNSVPPHYFFFCHLADAFIQSDLQIRKSN